MTQSPPRYLAYLLRLWQAGNAQHPVWRASLESAQTRELQGFASLDALIDFLRDTTEGCRRLEETPAPAPTNHHPQPGRPSVDKA